jgi:tRNA G18 (ribose-2'-O)-methylase SpoU
MFGSEADGLSKELKDFATKNLTIEMKENVESLNLSVSASIVMYKIFMK